MKITCEILKGHRKKGTVGNFYYFDSEESFYNTQYEQLPKEYEIQYKMRIVAFTNDNPYELVSKTFTPDEKTVHHLNFHTETYAYDCSTKNLYCLTLMHDI